MIKRENGECAKVEVKNCSISIPEMLGAEIAYYQSPPLICQPFPLFVAIENRLSTSACHHLLDSQGPYSHYNPPCLVFQSRIMPVVPYLDP